MLNKVILIGRLTTDIELRKSSENTSFCYFTLAVNGFGQNSKTDFVPCVAWRKTAELMGQYLSKGSLVSIEGRIDVYRKNTDGNYETRVTVNASNVVFLESSNARGNSNSREVSKSGTDLHFKNEDINMNTTENNYVDETSDDSLVDINEEEWKFGGK